MHRFVFVNLLAVFLSNSTAIAEHSAKAPAPTGPRTPPLSSPAPSRMAFRCVAQLPFSSLTVSGDIPLKVVESSADFTSYVGVGRLSIHAASPNGTPIPLRQSSIPVTIRAIANPNRQDIAIDPNIDEIKAELLALERKRADGRLSEPQYQDRRRRILEDINASSRLTDLYALQRVRLDRHGTTAGGSLRLRLTNEDYGIGLDFALNCNVTQWPFHSPKH